MLRGDGLGSSLAALQCSHRHHRPRRHGNGRGPASAAVPGPATSVTARAGDQLAEVVWAAPTPDDPTITGYAITASPADTPAVTVDPTARTATVTGLTNGTAYTFTVAARAACGTRARAVDEDAQPTRPSLPSEELRGGPGVQPPA
jgi:hypothetical protein